MTSISNNNGFYCVDYHYVRPKINLFPRLIGVSFDDFKKQISHFQDKFQIIDLKNIQDFYQKNFKIKNGMLITFDDGLSDHFATAKFLSDKGIRSVFFINSCIISDELPPNPTIIHHAIAKHGIELFLKEYENIIDKFHIKNPSTKISFTRGESNIFTTIDKIKNLFKYKFDSNMARKILIELYECLLLSNDHEILSKMHLTKSQIKEILEMGHSIGTHTHTHVSISNHENIQFMEHEFNFPKQIFEKTFNSNVISFSYPFGDPIDCFSSKQLQHYRNKYEFIFTVEHRLNTIKTPKYDLGRYEISKHDTIDTLDNNFNLM